MYDGLKTAFTYEASFTIIFSEVLEVEVGRNVN
jgi:hypothetical protein